MKKKTQNNTASGATQKPPISATTDAHKKVDLRRQLFNDRKVGPIEKVQLPAEMITKLWAIMFDLDPHLFRKAVVPAELRTNPMEFYTTVVQPWLKRHPVLRDAEVRSSGRGLHVVIWFAEPVEFTTNAERQRWAGIVTAIQAVLPSDPDVPGITALTRSLGSTNSKNGGKVTKLFAGNPVDVQAVVGLFEALCRSPFRTVMAILLGTERCTPCPICNQPGSTLSALDHIGQCYGFCGKVTLAQLYDVFLKPRPNAKTGR